MKTTRRSFLGALAAFVFGVQAEVFRFKATIRLPEPETRAHIAVGELVYFESGKVHAWKSGEIPFGVALNNAAEGESVEVLISDVQGVNGAPSYRVTAGPYRT